MSDITKYLDLKKAERADENFIKSEAAKKLQTEFAALDFEEIRNKKDHDLAAWQAQYPVDSPQFIFALQAWNNRTITKQTKWMKFSAILAAVTTIIGVFIGAILQEYRESKRPPQPIEVICKTPDAPKAPNPTEITTQKKIEPQPTNKNTK